MARILSFSDFNELSEGYNFNGSGYGFEDLSSYVELSESEMLSLFEDDLYEAAPAGNTVKGGLFDFNDKNTYNAVKNVKTAVIQGAQYTFLTIGQGMKAYADMHVKAAKATGQALLNLAKFAGKVVIFTAAGLYVVTEAIANGLISLATSIFGYAKKGAIAIGTTIATALKNANDYFKKLGKAVFNTIKNDALAVAKVFMTGLYKVANLASQAAQAVAVLTVAAYKIAKTAFKAITNFAAECIYGAAKAAKTVAVKIGKAVGDFYNASVSAFKSAKDAIAKTTKAGVNAVVTNVKKGIDKTAKVASKIKTGVGNALKTAQNKIAKTGQEILSHGKAIWKALWEYETYRGTDEDIFESYVILEGQRYYVPVDSYDDYDLDIFGSQY
jgi:acyl-CoA-binding protein